MINIQVHEVESWSFDERETDDSPAVLRIKTLRGEQLVTLFPSRPEEARKPKRKKGGGDEVR